MLNRVTGLIDNQVIIEIPYSHYDIENDIITIFVCYWNCGHIIHYFAKKSRNKKDFLENSKKG